MSHAIIFKARRIVTMTSDEPEALAVAAGKVAASGDVASLRERFPAADVVDLGEAVIVPGFNDAHMHLTMAAENLLHLDVSAPSVDSLASLKRRIATEAATRTEGEWIRASRYDDAKMAEGRVLTRWDLDEVAPRHPVLVVHVAGHWGVTNSRGLELADIGEASHPPDGGYYGRDASGRLNGILYEQALFDFAYPALSRIGTTVAPATSFEDRLRGLERAVAMFNAAGLSSVTDALVGADEFALLLEGERRGLLTLRVNVLVAAEQYDEVTRMGLLNLAPDGFLRFAGVKTFVDGAIGGRTCLLEQPFEGTSDDYGIQTRSTEDLRDVVRRTSADGHAVCVHANGDRAISLILDLMEEAAAAPQAARRQRIEHCSIVTEEILRRMARLGATAVPFGSYVHYHGSKLLDWYGERRLRRMFAHRWFLDAGVGVAGSSDFPCGPYEPLLALQSCITRQAWDGPILGENQRITPLEALSLYTIRAAAATGEASRKGALAPGLAADFVVLEEDPLSVEPTKIAAIPVRETYVAGRRVYSDPDR